MMDIPLLSDKNNYNLLSKMILKSYFMLLGSFGMAEILHFSWLHGGNKGLNEVFVLSEDSEDRSMRPS